MYNDNAPAPVHDYPSTATTSGQDRQPTEQFHKLPFSRIRYQVPITSSL
jgi:hypothetical protein